MSASHPSPLIDRFLRYCRIDTQADPNSQAVPSTEKQKDLGVVLKRELDEMGVSDVSMDAHGYVFGTLDGDRADGPVLALLAHMDTAPDAPGTGVKPLIQRSPQ